MNFDVYNGLTSPASEDPACSRISKNHISHNCLSVPLNESLRAEQYPAALSSYLFAFGCRYTVIALSGQTMAQLIQPVHKSFFNCAYRYPFEFNWEDNSRQSCGHAVMHSSHALQISVATIMVPRIM